MDYFRYIIQPARLGILRKGPNAIHGLQLLANVTELKQFLALCNQFRRSVPNLERKAALLNSTLEKNQLIYFGGLNETEIEEFEPLYYQQVVIYDTDNTRDRTEFIRLKLMHVTTKSGASYCKSPAKDWQSP